MTCRATGRDRVLVVARRPSALPSHDPRPTSGRPRARGDPARGRRRGRRNDRPRRARAAARRSGPPGGRRHRRPAGLPRPPRADAARSARLAHAAGALFVAVDRAGQSWPSWRHPARTAPTSRRARASRSGIAPQYGGPYLGHPRLDRRAGPPAPRPPRRHDHRPRWEAGLRHDDAGARAGHPARQGGQQHLHQPGAARPGRIHLPGDDRSARTARRGRPGREPRGRARGRARGRRRRSGSTPARTSTSSRSASRTRGPSIGDCSTRASWPGSCSPMRSPTTRASSTACSCARRRSRRRPRSSSSRARAVGRHGVTPTSRSWPDERDRQRLQPTLVRAGPAGPRWRQDPAPAEGRPRPDPGRRPAHRPARPSRDERARRRSALRQPLAAQLRDRHRVLSTRARAR